MPSKLGTEFDCVALFEGPGLVRMTLAEVARQLGISKSTAHGALTALVEAEYLTRTKEGSSLQYVMGPRFQKAFADAILREVARLGELRDETNRAVNLALMHMNMAGVAMTQGKSAEVVFDSEMNGRPDEPGPVHVDPSIGPANNPQHWCARCGGVCGNGQQRLPPEQFDSEMNGRPDEPGSVHVDPAIGPDRSAESATAAPECGAIGSAE